MRWRDILRRFHRKTAEGGRHWKSQVIIDYSHLKGILESPPVFLPGILYLINCHPELFKKFETKIDITNCFYNAPIIPACRDFTTLEYKGKYWRSKPFGIQPAPYFAIRITKVVMDWIRSKGLSCLCHIDDILITSDNRAYLEHITSKVVERLAHADWQVSAEKSVLIRLSIWVYTYWKLPFQKPTEDETLIRIFSYIYFLLLFLSFCLLPQNLIKIHVRLLVISFTIYYLTFAQRFDFNFYFSSLVIGFHFMYWWFIHWYWNIQK